MDDLDSGAGQPEVKFCVPYVSTEQHCDFTVSRQTAYIKQINRQSTELPDDLDVIECLSVNKTTKCGGVDLEESGEPTPVDPFITNRVDYETENDPRQKTKRKSQPLVRLISTVRVSL